MTLTQWIYTLIASFSPSESIDTASKQPQTSQVQISNDSSKPFKPDHLWLYGIKDMLISQAPALPLPVINKVVRTIYCADKHRIDDNGILTVIDFSSPSNQKRLWVFDLNQKKLLNNTYVAHGIKSGTLNSTYFSNINNSKASSIGVFHTGRSYYGRYGLALKLKGLEKNINHNAYSRFIVMHGAWYSNESFIKKYGRPGRSWGCPALPLNQVEPVIHRIRDGGLFVAYYPNERWLATSEFSHCGINNQTNRVTKPFIKAHNKRSPIVFVDLNKNNVRDMYEPVVVISAKNYRKFYKKPPPLQRMLRRQIKQNEYIALSQPELRKLDSNKDRRLNQKENKNFQALMLVVPEIKKIRGYYATEMKVVYSGKLQQINLNQTTTVKLKNKRPYVLRQTDRFIRWLGL